MKSSSKPKLRKMIRLSVILSTVTAILVLILVESPFTFASGVTPSPFPENYPPDWQTADTGDWLTKQVITLTPRPTGTLWLFSAATDTPNPLELTPQRTPLGDGFLFGNNDQSAGSIGNVYWYSFWGVEINDRYITVYAGQYRDTTQGVIRVIEFTVDGHSLPDGGDYLAPGGSGPLRIVNAIGTRLILTSAQGQTFYFDVLGQTFTTSATDIVPTATPWPITPVPSLTPTLTGDAAHNPDDVRGLIPVYTVLSFRLYQSGEDDWFRFHSGVEGTIQVHLYNLPVDLDLYVYSVTRVRFTGHDGSSTNPGTESELVTIPNAPPDDYMVRVVGVNGAFDPGHPYQLEIDIPVAPDDLHTKTGVCVTDKGLLNSLDVKIDHQDWNPFINEVEAQTGKAITADCAHAMIGMASYLLNNPPPTSTPGPGPKK